MDLFLKLIVLFSSYPINILVSIYHNYYYWAIWDILMFCFLMTFVSIFKIENEAYCPIYFPNQSVVFRWLLTPLTSSRLSLLLATPSTNCNESSGKLYALVKEVDNVKNFCGYVFIVLYLHISCRLLTL